MRAHVKKKLYRLAVKQLVKAGRINDPSGSWSTNDDKNSMGRDLRAGHRAS